MKYCPYCGAELVDGAASFCAECGKSLPSAAAKVPDDSGYEPADKMEPKEPAPEPESEEKPEDPDYDGYYDDILPPDLDRQREGLDKKLIQRVAVITGVVAVIIGLCVAALYLL